MSAPGRNCRALLLIAALAACPAGKASDAQHTLRLFVASETTRLTGRVEVTLGAIEERLKRAPCAQPEPFIPAGARLWGRSTLGMRCVDATAWSALVPVHVKVYAPALVALRTLPAGQAANAADFRVEETDLTREPAALVTELSELDGQVLVRPVPLGTLLRRDHLRQRPSILQGDQVRLVYAGRGFTVSAFGKALNTSPEGQAVRVQLESGRVLTGTARHGRVVEVSL
jgi:flagella basal body P-ring formation protein FlgA